MTNLEHVRPLKLTSVILVVALAMTSIATYAQDIHPLAQQLVDTRVEIEEVDFLYKSEQITSSQFQERYNKTWNQNRSVDSQIRLKLPPDQRAQALRQAESLFQVRIVPLRERWRQILIEKQTKDRANNAARQVDLTTDANAAAKLQATRALAGERVRRSEITQVEFSRIDSSLEAQLLALQQKYDAYGGTWGVWFSRTVAGGTPAAVAAMRLADTVADTRSQVGQDATAPPTSPAQGTVPQPNSESPTRGERSTAPDTSSVKDMPKARQKADEQQLPAPQARGRSTTPAPAASTGSLAQDRPRETWSDNPDNIGLLVGGVAFLFTGLVTIFIVFIVYKLVTLDRRRRMKAQADAVRPTIEAWSKLGATKEEREASIKKMFDTKAGTVLFGHRYDVRNSRINSELQRGTSSIQNGHVMAQISRNVAAMEPREREFLRTVYLLYNTGLIDRPHWLRYSFAFVNGDGKAHVDSWDSSQSNVNDGAAAARFFVDHLNGSVDSAVNSLMGVLEKLGQQDSPAMVKEVHGRLRGGGAWFAPEDMPGTVFANNGPYAVRLGFLDGSTEVLSYGGEGSLITIAPPGSGKTQCFVLPNMLHWPGPAVVLDVKGEIYAATSKWRAANVGPVFKFSPLDPANSHCYNPLVFVREDPEYLWEDARFLADMMLVPSGASDPFWENMARDVLTAAIAYVCYENAPAQRPMSKIMDLLYGIDWDTMVMALRTNLAVAAMRQMGHSLGEMERKTRDSVLKTAQSSMSAWQGERISKATRQSDWSPLDLRSGKPTIYICVNPNEIDSLLSVLRVFIAQHIRMLTSQLPPRDAAPVLFVLDELPRLKKMPPVEEALNIGRQYGIRLWMFTQSYGQLKEAYPNAEGMLGSCAVRMFMNVPLNDELAQKLSDQLGYREGPLDASRTKLVEPLELAGPNYRDIALVLATSTKPAKVCKAFAYQDAALKSRMAIA